MQKLGCSRIFLKRFESSGLGSESAGPGFDCAGLSAGLGSKTR